MTGNVIVGQSGGPTAAINSSLAGVFRTAKDRGAGKVYGMLHGIKGLMEEDYIDLSDFINNHLDVELLKRPPAAYLGSSFIFYSFQQGWVFKTSYPMSNSFCTIV